LTDQGEEIVQSTCWMAPGGDPSPITSPPKAQLAGQERFKSIPDQCWHRERSAPGKRRRHPAITELTFFVQAVSIRATSFERASAIRNQPGLVAIQLLTFSHDGQPNIRSPN
jgi:hypothetical protein